ncbi:MAG: 4Fe-4S dicluster domain-containing protein, partial [Desulfomonilaceae bacterium]
MFAESYIDAFNAGAKDEKPCETCGACLQRCPVMKMSKEESQDEMTRLLHGEKTNRVLNECTFCFNCNHYCPRGLRPYALIMQRLADAMRNNGKGVPPYIEYLFTGKHDSSVFGDVYDSESEEEQQILDKWEMVPAESKEVLFIGCTGRMIPFGIEHSHVLRELPKYGPRKACCGELSYRYGDYKTFAETVERTFKLLQGLNTERLVCYCGSCANFLGNIWTNYHGVKLPFEVISIWEWLWEKVQTEEIKVARQIPIEVAITDSCYSSELGDRFFEAVRGLHMAAGMKIVELKNNKYENLTCGAISTVRNDYDLM